MTEDKDLCRNCGYKFGIQIIRYQIEKIRHVNQNRADERMWKLILPYLLD